MHKDKHPILRGIAPAEDLIERSVDPKVCRLFIVDGAKALTKVLRSTFDRHTPIQRCQIHKARNVIERLPKPLHASVRKALRQGWELDDADKAEQLLRDLACRLEQPPCSTNAAPALACLHQQHRKHDGDCASCLPQRKTMAKCRHGAAQAIISFA